MRVIYPLFAASFRFQYPYKDRRIFFMRKISPVRGGEYAAASLAMHWRWTGSTFEVRTRGQLRATVSGGKIALMMMTEAVLVPHGGEA